MYFFLSSLWWRIDFPWDKTSATVNDRRLLNQRQSLSLSLSFFMLHCLKCICSHVIVLGSLSQCATVVSAAVAFVHQRALTLSPPLFLSRTTFDWFFPDWEHQSCGYGQALNQSFSRHFGQVVMSIFSCCFEGKIFICCLVCPRCRDEEMIGVLHLTCQWSADNNLAVSSWLYLIDV